MDEQASTDIDLHVIIKNYATHGAPKVKRRLDRDPRSQMRLTPAGNSWPDIPESVFRRRDHHRLKRVKFSGAPKLIQAVMGQTRGDNDSSSF